MIDYEKMKIANDIAEKYSIQHGICLGINIIFGNHALGNSEPLRYEMNIGEIFKFTNIDDLIIKLCVLTEHEQPKPRYEIGDKVWFRVYGREWNEFSAVIENYKDNRYWVAQDWMPERLLYSSRESLIEAQIEYWKKLYDAAEEERRTISVYECCKCNKLIFGGRTCPCESNQHDNPKQCDHASLEEGDMRKCIHCGELYR